MPLNLYLKLMWFLMSQCKCNTGKCSWSPCFSWVSFHPYDQELFIVFSSSQPEVIYVHMHSLTSTPINDPAVPLFLSGVWYILHLSPCWSPRSRSLRASASSWLDRWENAFRLLEVWRHVRSNMRLLLRKHLHFLLLLLNWHMYKIKEEVKQIHFSVKFNRCH